MASVLEDKEEIRDLITRYCLYIDSGRYEDQMEKVGGKWLFTERKVRPDTRPAT